MDANATSDSAGEPRRPLPRSGCYVSGELSCVWNGGYSLVVNNASEIIAMTVKAAVQIWGLDPTGLMHLTERLLICGGTR